MNPNPPAVLYMMETVMTSEQFKSRTDMLKKKDKISGLVDTRD